MKLDGITISFERRPCWVDGKKAMWHGWTNRTFHLFQDGIHKKDFSSTMGLVEWEDGTMKEVEPLDIRFADHTDFRETVWDEQKTANPIDEAIHALDNLKKNSPDAEITLETTNGTVSCKISDALIYDTSYGGITIDAE